MVTGDEDLMIINNTINHVQLHTQQVTLMSNNFHQEAKIKNVESYLF